MNKHKKEMMEEHLSLSITKSTATEERLIALQHEFKLTAAQDGLSEKFSAVSKQLAIVSLEAHAAIKKSKTR